jgi:hypothetical protein
MRAVRYIGNPAWSGLAGKVVRARAISIEEMSETVSPFSINTQKPLISANHLFLMKCNKNFISTWLTRYIFDVKRIYLNSHPQEYSTLYHWAKPENSHVQVYVNERYWWLVKGSFDSSTSNIRLMTDEIMMEAYRHYFD